MSPRFYPGALPLEPEASGAGQTEGPGIFGHLRSIPVPGERAAEGRSRRIVATESPASGGQECTFFSSNATVCNLQLVNMGKLAGA